jgi:hypothetical protein
MFRSLPNVSFNKSVTSGKTASFEVVNELSGSNQIEDSSLKKQMMQFSNDWKK